MIDTTKTVKAVIKANVATGYLKELKELRKSGKYANHEAIKGIADWDLDAVIQDFEYFEVGNVYMECDTMQREYLLNYVEYKNPELIVNC